MYAGIILASLLVAYDNTNFGIVHRCHRPYLQKPDLFTHFTHSQSSGHKKLMLHTNEIYFVLAERGIPRLYSVKSTSHYKQYLGSYVHLKLKK